MTTIAVVTGNPKPNSRTHGVAQAVADALAKEIGESDTDRLVIDLAEHAPRLFDWSDPELTRLTAEVADWFGLDAGTLCKGDRADFVVIDPAGLDDSVDGYHEEEVPFYGGLRRMVNRNDAAVVATGVSGQIVYRSGSFRDGYGKTVKSGRFLPAAGHAKVLRAEARL